MMTPTEAIYFLLGATAVVLLLNFLGRVLLHCLGTHRERQMRIERLANRSAATEKKEAEDV